MTDPDLNIPPPCTASAFSAAIQQYSAGFNLSSDGYAYADADFPSSGLELSASESTYTFEAKNGTWQYAGNNTSTLCTNMDIPAAIYQEACNTNLTNIITSF
jgi:hypothetical protein